MSDCRSEVPKDHQAGTPSRPHSQVHSVIQATASPVDMGARRQPSMGSWDLAWVP